MRQAVRLVREKDLMKGYDEAGTVLSLLFYWLPSTKSPAERGVHALAGVLSCQFVCCTLRRVVGLHGVKWAEGQAGQRQVEQGS